MQAFLIYINVLSTVLGTSATSANINKQGKSLFLKKESLNYFLSCVSWGRKGARRKQKSLVFLVTPRLDFRRLPGPVLILPEERLWGDECELIFPNSGW